ncbi:MAG: prolyl oligopeptidase family serine peptidase [Myxococcales bacterium]|nr:prolyl oligopeptidase family serine peptidase [Myxococcales bacterium]
MHAISLVVALIARRPLPNNRGDRLCVQLAICLLGLAACGATEPAAGSNQADMSDAGQGADASDAGTTDAGATDASGGSSDAGATQADGASSKSWPLPAPTLLGATRKAKVLVPKSYDGKVALPVVMLLGGYDYLSQDLDDWIALSSQVHTRNFVLILPDGQIDSDGSPYWNATPQCCDFDNTQVDDAGWLLGLLDELALGVHIDPKRVSLVGHSAGGFMAYRLACDAPERFAAVVSIAGSGFVDPKACKAKKAVSVLQIHGTKDDIMPIDGDDGIPGALGITARWGARAGCDAKSWAKTGLTVEHADDGLQAETTEWHFSKGCAANRVISLWQMEGNDHYPEFRPVFTDNLLIWTLARTR